VSGGCGSSGDARDSESSDELQSVLSEGEALRAASALLLLLTHQDIHTRTHIHTHRIPRMQGVLDNRRIACCRCIAVCRHMFVDIWQLYADTHTSMHTSIIVHACINECILVCIRLCTACRKSASITAMYVCIEHTCMTEGSTRQSILAYSMHRHA
jgi:hypothetical protein